MVTLQNDSRQGARGDWRCISEVIPKCLCNLGDTVDSKWRFEKTGIYYCLQTFNRRGCVCLLRVFLGYFTSCYFLEIQASMFHVRMNRTLGLSVLLTGLKDKITNLSASWSLINSRRTPLTNQNQIHPSVAWWTNEFIGVTYRDVTGSKTAHYRKFQTYSCTHESCTPELLEQPVSSSPGGCPPPPHRFGDGLHSLGKESCLVIKVS